MLAPLLAFGLLTSVGLARAGCQEDVACQKLGCQPDVQVVLGNTEIKEPRTTNPPYDLNGFPGATSIGANDVGGGTTSVTWRASEQTTLVVPRSTPAANGQPGTTYFVATSTFEYGGVKYEKPYVASTTSTSFTKTETSTTTQWQTTTTTSVPPPVFITETSTTTTTTTSIPPPVTSVSTTTFVPPPVTEVSTSISYVTLPPVTTTETKWFPTTVTETSTSTVTTTTPYCEPTQPPARCTGPPEVYQAWKNVELKKDSSGKPQPVVIPTNYGKDAWFTVVDAEFKVEQYSVTLDGSTLLGTTNYVPEDTGAYCSSGDECFKGGWSSNKFRIPAGSHTVAIAKISRDNQYIAKVWWKAEEKCD